VLQVPFIVTIRISFLCTEVQVPSISPATATAPCLAKPCNRFKCSISGRPQTVSPSSSPAFNTNQRHRHRNFFSCLGKEFRHHSPPPPHVVSPIPDDNGLPLSYCLITGLSPREQNSSSPLPHRLFRNLINVSPCHPRSNRRRRTPYSSPHT